MGTVHIVEGKVGNEISSVNVPAAEKHPLKSTSGGNEPEQMPAALNVGHEKFNRIEHPVAHQALQAEFVPVLGQKLGKLWDRFGKKLVLYARQWCRSPDDVVQETFIKLAQLQCWPDDPITWLFVAVRNRAIDQGDSEHVRTKNELGAAQAREQSFVENHESEIASQEVIAALETLDLHFREVIMLRLWSEFTFDEIANITGESASTVHRHYAAAIKELQAKMCGKGTEDRG